MLAIEKSSAGYLVRRVGKSGDEWLGLFEGSLDDCLSFIRDYYQNQDVNADNG